MTPNVGANDPRNKSVEVVGRSHASTSERRAEAAKGERVFVDLPSLASPLRTRSRFPPNPPSIRHLTSGGDQKNKKTPHLARWLAAPSGRGRGSPSGPQSVPALPACRCLMSAYEQTFDCQVAVPPRHADQPEFCHCCSNPGASKGGLGFPK